MDSLSQLLYISDARKPLSDTDLQLLVARCQPRNKQAGITGILVFSQGHFLQLLEGHGTCIYSFFSRISCDPRHCNVRQLHFDSCRERIFPNPCMELSNLDTAPNLERIRLKKIIDQMSGVPTGRKLLNLLRQFRDQLPGQLQSRAGGRSLAA